MDMTFWITIGLIVILLVVSAFFSGAETALTGASRARLHQLEQDGNRRARLVNRLRERKELMIGALLLGNSALNILTSALATGLAISAFGEAGVVYATLIMTGLILIFAEVMPKTYAINYADRTSLFIAPVVRVVVSVLAPVTLSVAWLVLHMLRLMGADIRTSGLVSNEEELRGAIELHRSVDTEEEVKEERAMLRSILDLTDVEVSQIMTHRRNVVMIDASLPPGEIVDAVLNSAFTRVPLWQGDSDNVIGVLHAKALLREVHGHGGQLDKMDILAIAHKPWFTPDTTTLFDQLQAFRKRREHFALVVDEYGSLMGVVTLEDVLEEIVGEIADEHDVQVAGVQPEPGGSFIVDGRVPIRDLNREFEWRLPDERASTIAGLVLNEARRIPNIGQIFVFYDFRFEILGRQRHQITSLRLTPPSVLEQERKNGEASGLTAS
ncbi:MAG: HlyC/CorC family transporter [Rhodospirillaceae bacterium]